MKIAIRQKKRMNCRLPYSHVLETNFIAPKLFYSSLMRNSLKEICLIPFSSLEVRNGVAMITYFG